MGFQYISHHLATKVQASAHLLNVLDFEPFSCFVKMGVFKTGIHKMPVRIANREDPDQTAS